MHSFSLSFLHSVVVWSCRHLMLSRLWPACSRREACFLVGLTCSRGAAGAVQAGAGAPSSPPPPPLDSRSLSVGAAAHGLSALGSPVLRSGLLPTGSFLLGRCPVFSFSWDLDGLIEVNHSQFPFSMVSCPQLGHGTFVSWGCII